MRILKFGGSSIAQVDSLKKVHKIVNNINSDQTTILIVSALGGVTDSLSSCLELACSQNKLYLDTLENLHKRHLDLAEELSLNTELKTWLDDQFSELSNLLQGIFILQEVPEKVRCRVLGLGEVLSSHLIVNFFKLSGLDAKHFDSRKYIKTQNGKGILLNRDESYRRIKAIKQDFKIGVFPG